VRSCAVRLREDGWPRSNSRQENAEEWRCPTACRPFRKWAAGTVSLHLGVKALYRWLSEGRTLVADFHDPCLILRRGGGRGGQEPFRSLALVTCLFGLLALLLATSAISRIGACATDTGWRSRSDVERLSRSAGPPQPAAKATIKWTPTRRAARDTPRGRLSRSLAGQAALLAEISAATGWRSILCESYHVWFRRCLSRSHVTCPGGASILLLRVRSSGSGRG
jgi:hypothetical protein